MHVLSKSSLTRRLVYLLIFSCLFNLLLFGICLYYSPMQGQNTSYIAHKPLVMLQKQQLTLAKELANKDYLYTFRKMPFEKLKLKLHDSQWIEDIFSVRDLALASLCSFHEFDIHRALFGYPFPAETKTIKIGNDELMLYCGLSEGQFQAIIDFVNTEKWPFTPKGLFLSLKQEGFEKDPSLAESFYRTEEFLALEVLFNRAEASIQKKEILALVLDGEWQYVRNFFEQQKLVQDLSPLKRQRLLLDYLIQNSKNAAQLILKTDFSFALHKAEDFYVQKILKLIEGKSIEGEKFALGLLVSSRSCAVWEEAAIKLYQSAREPIPKNNLHHAAVSRFITQNTVISLVAPEELPKSYKDEVKKTEVASISRPIKRVRAYTVQEGDTLWKIAKRFKVNIEVLKAQNNLKNDFLVPGTRLKIP